MKTVVVGMSGGVDSSVSALLLKQEGYRVIGLFMKNWEEADGEGVCLAAKEYEDVVKVCDQLQIPCYTVNFAEEYRERVFSHFLKELALGFTPNPDILCNREIKFKVFFDKAMALGADYLATGHYCQTQDHRLLKGNDPGKDQSYFLYTLKSEILKKVLFPVGGLHKPQVRELARTFNLATSEKKDSTGICFIGKRNFKSFLSQHLAFQPGAFMTLDGTVVGRHEGLGYYTIGQRKGLGIGGAGEAWFVLAKDVAANAIYVGQGEDHPSLYASQLTATELTWVAGEPASFPFSCKAKIRYRQEDQECIIQRIDGDQAWVSFPIPQRAITPRQSIVFYTDDICLGGAMIKDATAR